jgi:hypothetical protein
MADLDKPFVEVDDPHQPRSAGEEIGQPLTQLSTRVAGGEDFNRQIGRAWEEGLGIRFGTHAEQASLRHERDIRGAAVAVARGK